MIKIGCLLNKKNGVVAGTFSEANHVVIMDAESGDFLKEFARGKADDTELARMIAAEDPEAIITGELDKEPFEVIADEFMITRYYGAGLKASEALRLMNEYRLRIIPDHIGGTGCGAGGECHDHSHKH